jgi:hypothetical protein
MNSLTTFNRLIDEATQKYQHSQTKKKINKKQYSWIKKQMNTHKPKSNIRIFSRL